MNSWSEGTIKREKQRRKTKDPKDTRYKQISVRLTENEYEELKDISRYTGYNFSEILRYNLKEFEDGYWICPECGLCVRIAERRREE